MKRWRSSLMLAGVALGIGTMAASGQMRGPQKSRPEPPQGSRGPFAHTIHAAVSPDGLTWREETSEPLALHASVPSAILDDAGAIRVYFVDASQGPERLGGLVSTNSGRTFTSVSCRIEGLGRKRAVDFCPVRRTDGRLGLYFYAFEGNVHAEGDHSVESAVSDDGMNFQAEGPVFTYPGLVDPDVFWNGKEWIMHVFSLAKRGNVVAVSPDGKTFQYRGMLSPPGYGVTQPVRLADGRFRMYGFEQPHSTTFVSFISEDGYAWTKEPGIRFQVSEKYQVTDPFVVRLPEGSFRMVYKREKASGTKPAAPDFAK